uniref:Uncharacterized protein n=1 Tax=Meloidogyne enterolobii TaxID=390850 RepID=A0A6V7UC94_MELEN|nr:unnamed protein product [Meloidogyne enterolobii]
MCKALGFEKPYTKIRCSTLCRDIPYHFPELNQIKNVKGIFTLVGERGCQINKVRLYGYF